MRDHFRLILICTSFLIINCCIQTALGNNKKGKKHRMLSVEERAQQNLPDLPPKKVKAKVPHIIPFIELYHEHTLNESYREGVDVSRYQGRIDWKTLATEGRVSYAYIKATEGSQLVDRTYTYNITEARKAGLSVGSYHFYRPNVSVKLQIANMTANVLKKDQDLVPLVDIEVRGNVTHSAFITDLQKFIDGIEAYYGKRPLLYTYQNFYNKYLVGQFKGYYWMIAKYQSDPPILHDNVDMIMWQYTQTGKLPGVKGNIDRSYLMSGYNLQLLKM